MDRATECNYRQIPCQKAVNDDNFPQGNQDYIFSVGKPSVWFPGRSYFAIDMTLNGRNNAATVAPTLPPIAAECIAFADNAAGNLWSNAYFRIADQDVSSMTSFIPQCSVLKQRMHQPQAWLKSIGLQTQLLEADFTKRLALTSFASRVGNAATSSAGSNSGARALNYNPSILPLANGASIASTVVTTIAITAPVSTTGAVNPNSVATVTGGATFLGERDVGATLVVNGIEYVIQTVTSTTAVVLTTILGVAVADTADAYLIVNVPPSSYMKNKVRVIYQPPLGVFDMDINDGVFGAGQYRLSLNPNANYKVAALDTTKQSIGSLVGLAATNFADVIINDVKFYMYNAKLDMEEGTTTREFREMMCQPQTLQNNTNLQQFNFTVPSSTRGIAVFCQSQLSGSNAQFPPSKFRLGTAVAGPNDAGNNLSNLQITYGSQTLPNIAWTSALTNGAAPATSTVAVQTLAQRYHDNLLEMDMYDSAGGAECLEDFLKRGLYIYYDFKKDKNDRSTQVQLNVQYGTAPAAGDLVYICVFYTRAVEIITTAGAVVSVRSLNV